MPREKTVFKTDRIAHLWAHKTQESARNACRNFYFEGDTIYSYGSHFPIARHIVYRGKPAILFTTRGYSVTTSKHISLVRRAIPSNIPVFYCDLGRNWFDASQVVTHAMQTHIANVTTARQQLNAATRKPSRVKAFASLKSAITAANEFSAFFGQRKRFKLPVNAGQLEAEAYDYQHTLTVRRDANDAKRRERWENMSAENKRITEERRECERIDREDWESNRDKRIEAWRNGDSDAIPYQFIRDVPTMLRISGDNVETSQGVDIPLDHALRAMPLVERILTSGEAWHTNGHSIHLGHYRIDSIDADGTLHAGCHHIAKDEVLRLIEQLKGITV